MYNVVHVHVYYRYLCPANNYCGQHYYNLLSIVLNLAVNAFLPNKNSFQYSLVMFW